MHKARGWCTPAGVAKSYAATMTLGLLPGGGWLATCPSASGCRNCSTSDLYNSVMQKTEMRKHVHKSGHAMQSIVEHEG